MLLVLLYLKITQELINILYLEASGRYTKRNVISGAIGVSKLRVNVNNQQNAHGFFNSVKNNFLCHLSISKLLMIFD
jgi:hypothetical protein